MIFKGKRTLKEHKVCKKEQLGAFQPLAPFIAIFSHPFDISLRAIVKCLYIFLIVQLMDIGIIGVGNIGGALAHSLLHEDGLSLYLYDVDHSVIQGKCLDLYQAAICAGKRNPKMTASPTIKSLSHCDIIVITAGKARQPGMDRKDLLNANFNIISSICKELMAFQGILIVVTNPVDLMTLSVFKTLSLPRQHILGMAGALDSSRMKANVCTLLGASPSDIQGCVIGAHNDNMIPIRDSLRRGGLPLSDTDLSATDWEHVMEKTRKGGAEIVSLLKTGSAFYAPAEAIKSMILAICYDSHAIMPCSVYLQGEYETNDLCVGVPVVMTRKGFGHILSCTLSAEEKALWMQSVQELATMRQTLYDQ